MRSALPSEINFRFDLYSNTYYFLCRRGSADMAPLVDAVADYGWSTKVEN